METLARDGLNQLINKKYEDVKKIGQRSHGGSVWRHIQFGGVFLITERSIGMICAEHCFSALLPMYFSFFMLPYTTS